MPPLTTVLDTIDKGTTYLEKKGVEDARRNMQLLVTHLLGCSRVELYMQFDRPMTEEELIPLREKLKRRGDGEPLQHLLGTVEFYRREFKTDARALIPRPETEELADIILKHPALQPAHLIKEPIEEINETAQLEPTPQKEVDPSIDFHELPEDPLSAAPPLPDEEPDVDNRLKILDMGTGSGVLGLTLASELGGRCASITLADISEEALSLAKENTDLLGITHHRVIQSDLFSQLQGESFDLIVANLPYIAESDRSSLSAEVLRDPDSALFGGADGLDVIRTFIEQAPDHLRPGGMVALEIGYNQSSEVESLLKNHGFDNIQSHKDLNQIPRFPIAIFP